MLERLGLAFEAWVRKHMPDPFVLVLLLTLATFILAGVYRPDGIPGLPAAWLDGFWKLLSFAMQMVLIVVTGEAIVSTRSVQTLFRWISSIPSTPSQALWVVSTFALAAGWIHWGFGLIGAALLAKEMARVLARKKIRVDYPLMGTAAYMAMLLWHAGMTASAPLLINTPKHFLEDKIGIVPLAETIFLPSNIVVCVLLFLLVPWIIVKMHPKTTRPATDYIDLAPPITTTARKVGTPAERLDNNPWLGRIVGLIGFITLGTFWAKSGFDLTHNIVNFLLLAVGLFIHGSPISYAKAISESVRGTSGIILQFPFYGGIMGLMEGSHLGRAIAEQFVQISNARTLPFFSYLASVMTKVFVPSGGGEWAVEGPVMLEAAKAIGAAPGKTTMGIAYGNMVGNMFQPFWAIPLLAVLGLTARDIMGYCLVVFLFAFPILGVALLVSN